MNLVINQPTTATITKTACSSYLWHGTTYTTSGSYTFDSLNAKGCDSLTTLKLTINEPTTATITKSACSSYTWHGTTYTTSGAYTFDSLNTKGCDSLTILDLTINEPTSATISKVACSSYTWHGTTYTTSGSYTYDSLNAKGCDSLTTLKLTIHTPTTSTITIGICAGSSYTWHGTSYSVGGVYTFDSLNVNGCDSLSTLNLIINQPTTATINQTACGSYTWHGTTYTASGSYTFDSLNAKGCDSLTTLDLTINEPTTATITKTACSSYLWHGTTYTASGSYTFDSLNAKGCDSLTTLDLTINEPSTATITTTACSSYTWHGTTYTTSGSYTFDSLNAKGCDSLTTLNLTISPTVTPSVAITASITSITVGTSITFIATPTNGGATPTYQWLKNGVNITGATGGTLTTSSLSNNDSISCILTSTASCVVNATATSNVIGITVNYLYTISGSIKNPLGAVIPTVTVALNGNQSFVTDVNGNYSFTVPADSSFVIMPSKNNDVTVANGVNGTDISLIQSHILKKVILNSPYKLIAADVNSDGAVNGTDIALIKSLILKHITKFSGNKLWAFVDSNYTFPTPTKPFPFYDSISIAAINANQTGKSFIGVKLGDVNFDWQSAVLGIGMVSTPIELYNDKVVVNNTATEVRVPVKVNNFKEIMGLQYTLNFNSDVLELKSIENNKLGIDYNTDYAAEGKIPFLWVNPQSEATTLSDSSVLFELVFNKKGNLSNESINLTSDITSVSAFNGNYGAVGIVKAGGSISDAITPSIANADSWNVSPNPTKDGLVKVALSLASEKKVLFELTNLEGKLLLQQANNFPIGNSSMVLDLQRQVRLSPGVYYLKAKGIDGVSTKQVLFIK